MVVHHSSVNRVADYATRFLPLWVVSNHYIQAYQHQLHAVDKPYFRALRFS